MVSRFYNRGKWMRSVFAGNYGYLPHGDSAGRIGYYRETRPSYKSMTRKQKKALRETLRIITLNANALAAGYDRQTAILKASRSR